MPAVDVIVPFAGRCPHRQAAFDWVADRYATLYPQWRVTPAVLPSGPWVKAVAVNAGVAASDADVVVVADGDCWAPDVGESVERVLAGEPVGGRRRAPQRAVWAVPFYWVHRFTPEFTARVLNGADPGRHTSTSLEERRYAARDGGGIVVVRRDVALDVPMDPRFVGWGGEDVSWGAALRVLHGRPWRAGGDLWHLWHPPQDRPDRVVLPADKAALARRYTDTHRAATMRALVDEVAGTAGSD